MWSSGTMTPLLLKHLAASVSRHVVNMSRLNLTLPSPAASVYRSLYSLTTAPRALLLSSVRISSLQHPSSCTSGQFGSSLLRDCRHLPWVQPSGGMKTKSALKRRCKDCFFARRRGHLFVFCKTNPRHKQRQG
ncbi:39S ribosomal protein L36, mitochondrial [Notolabrus celidotus]|uniref:39S ribosomal protein L36, mitochondrial n=1 Tax=Notolabrus celidotus TaxID=1203425 RepID=UPI0014903EAA|nr:39S ribosomal protein L36, mitochondrial [Notolabrus celidotus]